MPTAPTASARVTETANIERVIAFMTISFPRSVRGCDPPPSRSPVRPRGTANNRYPPPVSTVEGRKPRRVPHLRDHIEAGRVRQRVTGQWQTGVANIRSTTKGERSDDRSPSEGGYCLYMRGGQSIQLHSTSATRPAG